jgi:ABC-2 type transport system ATP-binding protein
VSDTSLRFFDVGKRYGAIRALSGCTFAFGPGRVAAIVGPNGAGKTTLLRIGAKLQFADSGHVEVRDVLYYGGFQQLPVKGMVNQLRASLGLGGASRHGNRKLSTLSSGELQRVGLEIAFDLDRDVLLLDEPWGSLEPDSREELNRMISSYAVRHTVLCSSHDLDEVARTADDVVLLSDGEGQLYKREDFGGQFNRDDLLDVYRQSKRL